MERRPNPPHERTWRHPAELAAEERERLRAERLSTPLRNVVLITGSLGLIALAGLLATITPPRGTSTAITATTLVAGPFALVATEPTPAPPPAREAVPIGTTGLRSTLRLPVPIPDTPLAVPVEPGAFAVAVAAELVAPAPGADLDIRLPDGTPGRGRVHTATSDIVVVVLADDVTGWHIADVRPGPVDPVIVLTEPPFSVAYEQLADVIPGVAPGTPVIDTTGRLIGLCGQRGILDVNVPIALAGSGG